MMCSHEQVHDGSCTVCLMPVNSDAAVPLSQCRFSYTQHQCPGRHPISAEYCPQCFRECNELTGMSKPQVDNLRRCFKDNFAEKLKLVRTIITKCATKTFMGLPATGMVTTSVIILLQTNRAKHQASELHGVVADDFLRYARTMHPPFLPDDYSTRVRDASGCPREFKQRKKNFVRSIDDMLLGVKAAATEARRSEVKERFDSVDRGTKETYLGAGATQYHLVPHNLSSVPVTGIYAMSDDAFMQLLIEKGALTANKVVRGVVAAQVAQRVVDARKQPERRARAGAEVDANADPAAAAAEMPPPFNFADASASLDAVHLRRARMRLAAEAAPAVAAAVAAPADTIEVDE
jgi:hypothetical protein